MRDTVSATGDVDKKLEKPESRIMHPPKIERKMFTVASSTAARLLGNLVLYVPDACQCKGVSTLETCYYCRLEPWRATGTWGSGGSANERWISPVGKRSNGLCICRVITP